MTVQQQSPISLVTRLGLGEPVTRQVLRELKRAIVTLELRPGMRLSETEIAQRFGVSRQPVREALISLAATRLVEIQPQRGTVVLKISGKQMLEARFVREAIEVAVVRRAAAGFDPRLREEIDAIMEEQHRAVAAGDLDRFHRADERFHIALCHGADCALAWRAIEDIKIHMDRICRLTLTSAPAMGALAEQHLAILAAVDAGDAEAAAAAMQAHLTEILKTMTAVERAYPELFED